MKKALALAALVGCIALLPADASAFGRHCFRSVGFHRTRVLVVNNGYSAPVGLPVTAGCAACQQPVPLPAPQPIPNNPPVSAPLPQQVYADPGVQAVQVAQVPVQTVFVQQQPSYVYGGVNVGVGLGGYSHVGFRRSVLVANSPFVGNGVTVVNSGGLFGRRTQIVQVGGGFAGGGVSAFRSVGAVAAPGNVTVINNRGLFGRRTEVIQAGGGGVSVIRTRR